MSFPTQELAIVLVAQIVAVTSPGPDFALVSKNALVHSRKTALWTSLGVSVGCLFHLAYCLLGLALLISKTPWLFQMIQWGGAAYLIYLGLQSIFSKKEPQSEVSSSSTRLAATQAISLSNARAFFQGLVTNLLNPKATLFFLSVFTQVVSTKTTLETKFIYAVLIFLITWAWFSFCSFLLSHWRLKAALSGFQSRIEKITGLALILIGFRILIS